MHWSKKIAEDVISKHPNLKEYAVASGISPSGSIHIGNFREFITNYYVAKALQTMGKKVKLIFSWDEFDRWRKVPKVVADKVGDSFNKYVGCALADIPNPFGTKHKSYAAYFEAEFEKALAELQMNEVPVQHIYQAAEYKSGRYADAIIHSLKNRKKIYDILISFKTQDGDEGDRENYYPIQIYCPTCGKDSTRVLSCSKTCETVEYECKCGDKKFSATIKTADNVKLAWKIDWPMRWKAERVTFEAAGPDHQTEGGSYQVSSRIAREIFDIEPPMTCTYGWIGVKGMSSDKMSSSKGQNITPATCLDIYEPEIIRYLFAKYDNNAPFEFGFDDTIIRHYMEFDRGVQKFLATEDNSNHADSTTLEEYDKTTFELSLFKNTKAANQISFGTLATVAPLANFDNELIAKMLEHNVDAERIQKVKFWLENYAPEKIYKLRDSFNMEFFATLTVNEKGVLKSLHGFLENTHTEKEIQEFLYQIINDSAASKKENIASQQRYFKIFYNMLFGRDDGPRLYLYLAVADKTKYLQLLVN